MAKGDSEEAASAAPPAELDRSPSQLLHRALQVSLDIYAEEFGASPLTQRQYAVLAAVESREGLTQTDLVRATGIDRSTLADMVARMISKGLLARERSLADARANAVRLTDTGREALAEARPRMAAVDARLIALISAGKRDSFLNQLRLLAQAGDADAAADEAAPKPAKAKKAKDGKKADKAKGEKRRKKAKKAA